MGEHGSRGKAVSALVITIVAAVVALAAASAFIGGEGGPGPIAAETAGAASTVMAWRKGACVSREGARFDLVSCAEADGRVISVVGVSASDCPADTDELVRIGTAPPAGIGTAVTPTGNETVATPPHASPPSAEAAPRAPVSSAPAARGTATGVPPAGKGRSRTACVRNLGPPHSGAPGAGGGVLRAGDCVALRGGERPCAGGGWYGKAVAVVGRTADCPERTLDALAVGARTVACLGGGGRVLAAGDCVAKPDGRLVSRERLGGISCGSASAWAKVTARARSGDGCPDGSDRYLRAREPNVYRPVICLRQVARGDST